MKPISETHPIRQFFQETIDCVIVGDLGIKEPEGARRYLSDLLVRFVSWDGIYGIKDEQGQPVTRLTEMVLEGDIRQRAETFERERQVHRHIGDYLLFWSGMYPERLVKMPDEGDLIIDPVGQAKTSYEIAASFAHPPFEEESPVLYELSHRFELYQLGLNHVRQKLGPNWHFGLFN
jgi:hypothetical protein